MCSITNDPRPSRIGSEPPTAMTSHSGAPAMISATMKVTYATLAAISAIDEATNCCDPRSASW